MVSKDNEQPGLARPVLRSRSYGSSASPKLVRENSPRSSKDTACQNGKLSSLHPRNLVPTQVAGSVQSPAKTVVASVVEVFVNDNQGHPVTSVVVPLTASVISLDGFAPITLGSKPASASASPSTQSNQTPSPASSSNAAQTIQVQATRTQSNGASSSPLEGSMSVGIAGTQSQAVLSSPPSTPLPSSPSSSPSASSTGSYFSSAPNSAQSSVASQSANGQPLPANSGNSTITAVSSTAAVSTSTFNPAVFTTGVNSTLITSTRSRSSQTSGAFLTTSGSSFSTTSSAALSSSGSATASQSQSPSSSISPSSSTPSATGAVVGGGVGGSGGASGTSSSPSSTAGAGAGSGSGGSGSTPAVVGGVVGGVAGLAILLLILLFLLRRRRAKSRQRTISPPIPQTQQQIAGTDPTTERSSMVPFAAGALLRRMRPSSGHTAATTDTAPSERGFQNMGGRKLESVLSSRGDGFNDPVPPTSGVPPRNYGGTAAGLGLAAGIAQPGHPSRGPAQGPSPGPSDDSTLSGSSFYRDSHGFYGGTGQEDEAGPGSSLSTSPTTGQAITTSGPSEIAITRPSPARTPVINQPGFAPIRQPPGTGRGTPPPGAGRGTPPPRARTPQLRQQDDVGRSHPSFDGSRGSRFAEDI